MNCRICKEKLPDTPILYYQNMPGSAQGFLDFSSTESDHGYDLRLYQCNTCGLAQLSGGPVPYYREVIRSSAFSPEMRDYRQRQFSDWVNRFQLIDSRVLEVGCGRGEYLKLLLSSGMDAYGIEYNELSVQFCEDAGLKVIKGYMHADSVTLSVAPFDAFASFNFLEHWPDPIGSLRAIAANLVDGGVGIVEVPNFDMVVQKGLFSEFIADHLLYFTEETLRFTLQRSGFEVLSCRSIWHDYILSAEVRKRGVIDVALLEERRVMVTNQLQSYIATFPCGQVAIWGAGHQALAVISLTGIADNIRYIVDSAPFKQYKYTPASHLRIVPPDMLKLEPVQAVIVMAASYSNEVAAFLQSEYDQLINIVILRDDGLEKI